jgi:hypothetical protein
MKDKTGGIGDGRRVKKSGGGEYLSHGAGADNTYQRPKAGSSGADGGRVILPTGPTAPGGAPQPKKKEE